VHYKGINNKNDYSGVKNRNRIMIDACTQNVVTFFLSFNKNVSIFNEGGRHTSIMVEFVWPFS